MSRRPIDLGSLNPASLDATTRLALVAAIEEEERQRSRNKIARFFPEKGPFRRELYPKHLEFFGAGAIRKERLFMAANRSGKTTAGAYEIACHLTGQYPDWWQGRRFSGPIEAWACGTTGETTRDIVQRELLGLPDKVGTGMIPGDLVITTTPRRNGLSGAIETVWVKHVSGGSSMLGFKSYEQERKSFEGTAKHLIWCDEEPPQDCYTEMLYRTATTRGITLITFTPLQGMSEVVKGFIEPETDAAQAYKWFIQAGWNDVPHIDEEEKRALLATTPPFQIKARTLGEPSLGAGAIYPIAESEITCQQFDIPDSWPRVYALDVGWNRTAALWAAREPATGIIYVYSEHYAGQGEPASHALAIKSRGDWIPGVVDPACQGTSQIDGRRLIDMYRGLGLELTPAINAVDTGIREVWQLMVSGRLKFMPHLFNFFSEFRKYHREEKYGKIVKRYDHLVDCLRYVINSGVERMRIRPRTKSDWHDQTLRDMPVSGGNLWLS